MQKYITVYPSYEKKITGVNNVFHIELKEKSFSLKSDMKIFNDFFALNRTTYSRILINSFERFPIELIKGKITLYPTGKKLKEIDFFNITPYLQGVWLAVSEKALSIIKKYTLPKDIYQIPIKIESFEDKYYLIGLPITQGDCIDYSKSIFWNEINCCEVKYNSYTEYNNRDRAMNVIPTTVYIKSNEKYDVFNIAGMPDICISEKLLSELHENNCIGLNEIKGISIFLM